MNSGHGFFEPLDGSSNLETLIDDLYSQGYHQFTASGNLAGPTRKRHAYLSIEPSLTDSLSITVPDIGIKELYISFLWRGKLSSLKLPVLTLLFSDGKSMPLRGDQIKRTYNNLTVISGYEVSSLGTARIDVIISSTEKFSGTLSFTVKNRLATNLPVHAYLADDFTQWMNGAQFLDHITDDGTICTPGTSIKGITVGAYDPRGTRNTKGDINDFSSWGKTIDGRIGVELTAPGTLVYSLSSSSGTNNQPGGYTEFGGTSAALPHVAGCAALLLEAEPGLTPDELVTALEMYTLHDSFTGSVPNDIWGYGKLRVHDVFAGLNLIPTKTDENKPVLFTVSQGTPNPFNPSVSFDITLPTDTSSSLDVFIYNILGQKIFSKKLKTFSKSVHYTWDGRSDFGNSVSSGIYIFHFRHTQTQISRKTLLLR